MARYNKNTLIEGRAGKDLRRMTTRERKVRREMRLLAIKQEMKARPCFDQVGESEATLPKTEEVVVEGIRRWTYMEGQTDLMYLTGVVPFSRRAENTPSFWKAFLMGAFISFATLVCLNAFDNTKSFVIYFGAFPGVQNYIHLGFNGMSDFAKVFAIKFFVFDKKGLLKMLGCLDKVLELFGARRPKEKLMVMACILLMWLASLVMSVMGTTWKHFSFAEWNLKEYILVRSYEVGRGLLLWTAKNYHARTDNIAKMFGTNINALTITCGIIGTGMSLAGNMQDHVVFDFLIFIAVTLRLLICWFTIMLEQELENVGELSQEERLKYLRYYLALKDFSDSVNQQLGWMFRIFHLRNVAIFVYVLTKLLDWNDFGVSDFVNAISIIKILYFYWVAVDANQKGKTCSKIIKRFGYDFDTIEVDGRKVKAEILFEEFEKEPLGIGRDNFLINESFMILILSVIVSVFMTYSESKEKGNVQPFLCNCTCPAILFNSTSTTLPTFT